ncbi:MAG: adenosylcobinamide-GDP ribazoletransferase [Actinomycetales bacterium]|nr:adenosylcobinamide-GDP ribazoletransferase [Actinomycetales bacterium]
MPDALRLALGTLTAVRVPAPRQVTRTVAGRAMLLAPAVGALLGLAAAVVLDAVRVTAGAHRSASAADLLGSVLALVALALLTRGLHLDGLADTADGLGVKGDDEGVRQRRLAVMRAPDVGAFGVVAVVLVLLVQAAALAVCVLDDLGSATLVTAVTVGRLAVTWSCIPAVPSARPDGLGATVAGTVPRARALAVTAAVLLGAALLGWTDGGSSGTAAAALVVAALAGLLAAVALRRRVVTRLGGVTGDVLGALVEVTTAVVLVVAAVGLGLR